MKTFSIICAICVAAWGANELYQTKTHFGLLAKFASPTFKASPEWELPPLTENEQTLVNQILSQPFTYFARDSQAFAFISQDGQYILKLFKQHKWHHKNLLAHLHFSWNPYYQDYLYRQRKQQAVLSSCKTALMHVKEDTGMLYAHLNPTPLSVPPLRLTDKKGELWTLDLSNSCFLLQKKADLFYPHIKDLMEQGKIAHAKDAITSIINLLSRFMDLGVFENNAILRKNFGFIDNEVIQFDIGKFKFDGASPPDKQEIRTLAKRFRCWLDNNHYSELVIHLDQQLAELR